MPKQPVRGDVAVLRPRPSIYWRGPVVDLGFLWGFLPSGIFSTVVGLSSRASSRDTELVNPVSALPTYNRSVPCRLAR